MGKTGNRPEPKDPTTHLYLEKVLGRAVDLVEALLACIGQTAHGLRNGSWEARHR